MEKRSQEECAMTQMEIEQINSYECGLPSYLQHDLDAYKIAKEQGLSYNNNNILNIIEDLNK